MAGKRDAASGYEWQSIASEKQGASWGVIILLLVLFFPVGIGLALSKLHKESENFAVNGKNVLITGIVFAALGLLYLSAGKDAVPAFVVFGALGAIMIWQGHSYKKLGQTYQKYRRVLINSADGSIDNLASVLGVNYDRAVADLNRMIGKGLFPDSYVNDDERCFKSPLLQKGYVSFAPELSYPLGGADASRSVPRTKSVKCPNCGGINTINVGGDNLCDFCGSPLV